MSVTEPVLHLHYDEPVAVIGDIHGCAVQLRALLARLPPGTRPLVVGDVGDRGPNTREVIDMLIAAGAAGACGNHDVWLRDLANGGPFDEAALAPHMGGKATLASYGITGTTRPDIEGQRDKIPASHREWLWKLAVAVDLEVGDEKFWIVHAGIPSTVPLSGVAYAEVVPYLAKHHAPELMWAWSDPAETLPVDRPVVMGHVPRKRPLDAGHVLAIDTGCGTVKEGGRLTAVLLPERRFVTVGP